MTPCHKLPEELLRATKDARVSFFESQLLLHAHFQRALDELLLELSVAEPNTVIFLFGPPGVGKSMLFRVLKNEVLKQHYDEMLKDPGFIPVAGIEALEGESERFSWRDYRFRLLQELDPVGISHKLPMPPEDWRKTHKSIFPTAGALGRGDLRYALEQAIELRRVKVILVDEGDAIAKASSGRRQLSQLEVTKSEANLTEVPHVVFGTYDLWKYRDAFSNHLTRRTVDVHFARNRIEIREDYEEFLRVVRAFRRLLPLSEPPDLDRSMDFLYERTIGCIGSLKILLNKCLRHALDEKRETITHADIERHALKAKKCRSLITEAKRMEQQVEDSPADVHELREALGLKTHQPVAPEPQSENKGNGHKPGVRNPVRDPVGKSARKSKAA